MQHLLLKRGSEALQPPNVTQLHTFLIQFSEFFINYILKDVHKTFYFFRRATPILCGEGIDRKILYSEFHGCTDHATEILRPCLVTCQTRETAGKRPASITIHNHGNVTGKSVSG